MSGGFFIGSKAPRTRRGQQKQIFAIARSYDLTNDDLATIASAILGRTVESLSQDQGFSDEEMFVLWCVIRGNSEVNIARDTNGNLDKLMAQMQESETKDASEKSRWLNL